MLIVKRVEVVVADHVAFIIVEALKKEGFPSYMSSTVRGRGKTKRSMTVTSEHGTAAGTIDEQIVDKVKLELILDDKDVDKVVPIIVENAKHSAIGDGKIFISDVQEVIRLRTGERGSRAI